MEDKADGPVGRVIQLGTSLEVEIIDLDPCAQKEDVLSVFGAAVEAFDPGNPGPLRAQTVLTGFWQLESGT